jgi:hypothetical protein
MKRIVMDCDGDDVKIEVEGAVGGECKDLTRGIQEALGTTVEVQEKSEFYETETTSVTRTLTQ